MEEDKDNYQSNNNCMRSVNNTILHSKGDTPLFITETSGVSVCVRFALRQSVTVLVNKYVKTHHRLVILRRFRNSPYEGSIWFIAYPATRHPTK